MLPIRLISEFQKYFHFLGNRTQPGKKLSGPSIIGLTPKYPSHINAFLFIVCEIKQMTLSLIFSGKKKKLIGTLSVGK